MNRLKRPMAWMLCALLLLGQTGVVAHADNSALPEESLDGVLSEGVDASARINEGEEESEEESGEPEGESNGGFDTSSDHAVEQQEGEPADQSGASEEKKPREEPGGAPVSGAVQSPASNADLQGESAGAGLGEDDKPENKATSDGETQGGASGGFTPTGEAWALIKGGEMIDGTLQKILSELDEREEEAAIYLMEKGTHHITGVSMALFDRVSIQPDPDYIENADLYKAYVEMVTQDETVAFDISLLTAEQIQQRKSVQTPNEPNGDSSDSSGDTTDPGSGEPGDQENPGGDADGGDDNDDDDKPKAMTLTVKASGLQRGWWQNAAPTFSFTGIPEEEEGNYVYGVIIGGERMVQFGKGEKQYVPNEEGRLNFQFVILDSLGDALACSEEFEVMLDMTPPDIIIEQDAKDGMRASMTASDALSGVGRMSFDNAQTWEVFGNGDCLILTAYEGGVIEEGAILVRDCAGNIATNKRFEFSDDGEEDYGDEWEGMTGGGFSSGGSSSGKKTIVHVKETMDYSLVNYNALDLVFPEEPTAELIAGGTVLPLSMAAEINGETTDGLFSAKLINWRTDEDDARETPNALVLTAAGESEMNTWSFSGEAYRLLYNSGVEYLVFVSGEYMTAIPTEGFTGGTAYAKLKAGGISTRKFIYTLAQDETLRETLLSVEVEGETYLLGEEQDQPMYRYDVLIGTLDMMQKPFASFLPKNFASVDTEEGSGNEG